MIQGKETMEGQLIIFGEALFIKQNLKNKCVYLDKKKNRNKLQLKLQKPTNSTDFTCFQAVSHALQSVLQVRSTEP